jgi:hypothetical protein
MKTSTTLPEDIDFGVTWHEGGERGRRERDRERDRKQQELTNETASK